MLLKVILFSYSQDIVSSRGIERACREHVYRAVRGQVTALDHYRQLRERPGRDITRESKGQARLF